MIDIQDPVIRKKFQDNIVRIKGLLSKEGVNIFFVPSPTLQELILKDEHPLVKTMNSELKKIFLNGDGVAIEKQLVYDLINGKLDEKNSFVLLNGDIRVIENQDVKLWDSKKTKN